jgi:hypothetical protein
MCRLPEHLSALNGTTTGIDAEQTCCAGGMNTTHAYVGHGECARSKDRASLWARAEL